MVKGAISETPHDWFMRGYPGHTIRVPRDGRWTFDGNYDKPTFYPSINEGAAGSPDGHHFFVTAGVAHYLADKIVPASGEYWTIPPWDEDKNALGPK